MSTEPRKIVINVLPQSGEAWHGIALAVFCLAAAWAFNGVSSCAARSDEARYKAESVKITDNTVINAK